MSTKTKTERVRRGSASPDAEPMIIDTSKMNDGKRDALEMAEASRDRFSRRDSFCASMFMGDFAWDRLYPYPRQAEEDQAAGDAFLRRLKSFLHDHTDPDQIDATGEIPPGVMDQLALMGAFGIKVPAEYKGLGLSQTNYSRAATMLGSWCGNLTALISAHQSIGVSQPLLMFGTEAQKATYLPRVANGELSAFALTESGVGSDPAKMKTEALPDEDGEHYILNGEKIWCTNGTKAGVIVVMARTPAKLVNGRERSQISAFIVETAWPGVTVRHRCRFMGLKALYNGVIEFKDVRIPKENLILGEGRGLKVALATLNTGRLTLPAACAGLSKRCLEICRTWAGQRVQWGSPIGHHAAIADKIARITANLYATEAMTHYTSALVDLKSGDIRMEAAYCKMWGTERGWEDVDATMQIRGGRGFETAPSLKARGEQPIPIERMLRDSRINTLFEGSSEIMRLFIAREALDPHLRRGGAVLNPTLPLGLRFKTALSAALFYARWYPRQWLPDVGGGVGHLPRPLRRHVKLARRGSRRLARALFHQMLRHGPKLEREQLVLGHLVDIGAELFAISASCARAESQLKDGQAAEEILPIVDYFCREARLRIDAHYRALKNNNNRCGYRLARGVLDGAFAWMEKGMVR